MFFMFWIQNGNGYGLAEQTHFDKKNEIRFQEEDSENIVSLSWFE